MQALYGYGPISSLPALQLGREEDGILQNQEHAAYR